MGTKELTRLEIAEQAFDCCMQLVRSYGPPLEQYHRNGLIQSMEHFKKLAQRDIKAENEH